MQTSNNTRFKIQSGSTFAQFLTQNDVPLAFKTDAGTGGGTERMRIQTNGNVGIGEPSPDSLLHIGKGTNADDGAVTITIGGSSVNARQSSIIKNNAGSSDRALEIHATTASNNHETIKFFTDADTERMRIDSSGKVGIGKDNPSFLLEVKGSTQDTIRLNHSGETSSGSHNVKIVAGGAHYQNIHFEGSSIFYKTWNGSSVGERFRIRSTGGVTFNGDTADSNALDDYEEGSWTPQMYDANGSNVVLSVTSGSCFYTKVGRIVNASGIITRNETGSKSGMLTISHLPYTSYVGHSQLCAGSWWMDRDVSGGWGVNFLWNTESSPSNSDNMKYLQSESTTSEGGSNSDTTKDFGGWASNGFLLGAPFSLGADAVNGSGSDYVSWTFRKQKGFFDIVTYTGDTSSRFCTWNDYCQKD